MFLNNFFFKKENIKFVLFCFVDEGFPQSSLVTCATFGFDFVDESCPSSSAKSETSPLSFFEESCGTQSSIANVLSRFSVGVDVDYVEALIELVDSLKTSLTGKISIKNIYSHLRVYYENPTEQKRTNFIASVP